MSASLKSVRRNSLLCGSALAVVLISFSATPAEACQCAGQIEAAAQKVISSVTQNVNQFTQQAVSAAQAAINGRIDAMDINLTEVITANQKTQTAAQAKIKNVETEENIRRQKAADTVEAAKRYARSSNSCYSATAAGAMASAKKSVEAAAKEINKDQNDWSLGRNNSPTKYGPATAAAVLAENHENRIGGAKGDKDKEDKALQPDLLYNTPTYDSKDLTAKDGWIRDAMRLSLDPNPPAVPDPKNSSRSIQGAYLARAAQMSLARMPVVTNVANHSPAAGAREWAVGLATKAGYPADVIAKIQPEISYFQIMDLLANTRFGGADWYTTQVNGQGPEALQREALQMQSLQLKMQWDQIQLLERIGGAISVIAANSVTSRDPQSQAK